MSAANDTSANATTDDGCQGISSIGDMDLSFLRTKPNLPGLGGIIAFYLLILILGILSSWWGKRRSRHIQQTQSEDVMLAGRNIGLFVGIFTMTATWVGGGYINGTAELVFTPGYGLIWTQAPLGYAISLIIGGVMFAKKMRKAGYVTMLDPFERKYGRVMTAFLYLPALTGDIFWTAAILKALGASLSVIIGLNHIWAVVISAGISILYTFVGGLYSVAYTDVIQLICIFIGLWLAIPFAWLHPAVQSISTTADWGTTGWLGEVPESYWIGNYIDSALLLIFGGIPWQVYFQRVLSQKTVRGSIMLSIVAGIGCIIMAIPAVLIGAIAFSTDWNATEYPEYGGTVPIPSCDYALGLPLVMQFLTPTPVAVIGLGAVSAAVMSSADSSVLSSSSMFARNIYTPLRNALSSLCHRKDASETEIIWVMRVAVVFIGAAAAFMAIIIPSVYYLWYLCADFVYVVLFPQLVCVIYLPFTNTYGSFVGFAVGLTLRFLGGDPYLGLSPVIEYPWYDEESGFQLFPYKTLTMLISLIVIITVSLLVNLACYSTACPEIAEEEEGKSNQEKGDFPMTSFGSDNAGYKNDLPYIDNINGSYKLHSDW